MMNFSSETVFNGFTTVVNDQIISFDNSGISHCNGLQIHRELSFCDKKIICRIKITNTSAEVLTLPDIAVLKLFLPDFNMPFEDIRIFKLARQKNDVPGVFKPAIKDDAAYLDAVFDSAEVVAGLGVSADSAETVSFDTAVIEADPAMIILSEKPCFIGFAGQTNHLSKVQITVDHSNKKIVDLSAVAELDDRIIAPGETFICHDLIVENGDSIPQLLTSHVTRIADLYGSRQLPFNNVYCTWYYYGNNIDKQEITDNLEHISSHALPFQVYQLDNGWHNGFGNWDADLEKFPGGMSEIAQQISDAGMCPGIWTAPFVMQPYSEAVSKYPDIVLRNDRGEPCLFKSSYGNCYILDPFAANAEKYITELFHKLANWGYRYHKLDFLRAVFIYKNAKFARPATRAEAYRQGLQLIRDAVGDNGYINACGGLFEGSAGLADVVRSGADLRGHWHGGESGHIANYTMRMKQNIWRNFYNRLWTVDPDALQLRRSDVLWKNTKKHLCCGNFTDDEAYSIVVNQFIGGGIYCVSERFKILDTDREELLHFLFGLRNGLPQIIDDTDSYMPELFFSDQNRNLLCICNWYSEKPKKYTITTEMLPQNVSGKITDIHTGNEMGDLQCGTPFTVELAPHSAVIYQIG